MTKQSIIRLLHSYYSLILERDEAVNKIEELEKEKAVAIMRAAPKPEDGSRPGGLTSDPTFARAREAVDLYDCQIGIQTINRDRAIEQLHSITLLLGQLDKVSRTIVFWHYCKRHSWSWVASKIHYSSAQTRRKGYDAIDFLTKKSV